ncbi:MAG: hypothetical protein B9S32_09855 [Verrucomicrobia bacterium Tous-C9LFEB]|nr:MAG: hypothetical protein B9S32_09855 [Verrucomicrobia bacterium Tous-C9LFEB]
MNTTLNRTLKGLAIAAVCWMTTSAQAQVLYSQSFTNATGATSGVSMAGWNAYIGANAVNVTGPGSVAALTAGNSVTMPNKTGNPNTSNGFLQFYNGENTGLVSQSFSAVVTGLNLNLTSGTSMISWKMNTSLATSQELRLLVQVGGAWYVTNSTFAQTALSQSTAGNFDVADTGSFLFSTAASTWSAFTLIGNSSSSVADGTMAIGATQTLDLSSSTITGIGFYAAVSTRYNILRIDSLEVNAVPEPSSLMLLLGASGMLGMGLRRRRV